MSVYRARARQHISEYVDRLADEAIVGMQELGIPESTYEILLSIPEPDLEEKLDNLLRVLSRMHRIRAEREGDYHFPENLGRIFNTIYEIRSFYSSFQELVSLSDDDLRIRNSNERVVWSDDLAYKKGGGRIIGGNTARRKLLSRQLTESEYWDVVFPSIETRANPSNYIFGDAGVSQQIHGWYHQVVSGDEEVIREVVRTNPRLAVYIVNIFRDEKFMRLLVEQYQRDEEYYPYAYHAAQMLGEPIERRSVIVERGEGTSSQSSPELKPDLDLFTLSSDPQYIASRLILGFGLLRRDHE